MSVVVCPVTNDEVPCGRGTRAVDQQRGGEVGDVGTNCLRVLLAAAAVAIEEGLTMGHRPSTEFWLGGQAELTPEGLWSGRALCGQFRWLWGPLLRRPAAVEKGAATRDLS